MTPWEGFAVKYADRDARVRGDSFIFGERHDAPPSVDYIIWALRRGSEVILVNTG